MISQEKLNFPESYFPLKVFVCEKCWLVQVDEIEKAESIFNNEYTYFSSYSTTWLNHAREYVDYMVKRFKLNTIIRLNYITFLNSIWLTFISSIVEIIFLYMIYLLISASLSDQKYIIIGILSNNEKIIFSNFILMTIVTCAVNFGLKA
jgi:hypothetical protein